MAPVKKQIKGLTNVLALLNKAKFCGALVQPFVWATKKKIKGLTNVLAHLNKRKFWGVLEQPVV